MIVSDKRRSWLRTLFRFKGTAFQRIWKRVAFTTLVAAIVTYMDLGLGGRYQFHEDLTPLPFSLIGVALGIFLGFRNNTSYDRFWEGRKLWGRMVNTSRSLTRQILTLVGPIQKEWEGRLTDGIRSHYFGQLPTDEQRAEEPDVHELLEFHKEMVHRVAAYVHCFRMHLCDENPLEELRNTNTVEYVMKNGRLYEGDTLNEIWPRKKATIRVTNSFAR